MTSSRNLGARSFFSRLYWKIALIFLLLLMVLAAIYVYLTAYSAQRYFEATHQQLNREVAAHIVKFMPPFQNGKVQRQQAENIFFNVMVTNPSVEVYLLDTTGTILTYQAPAGKVRLQQVALRPIHQFIQAKGQLFIRGDDPRHPNKQKIFSAAQVLQGPRVAGYIYVVLTSEEYVSETELLFRSHVLRLGVLTITITLVAALVTGLLAFWVITKNLNQIIQTVKQFREGDWQARIPFQEKGELGELAATFNEMADTLLRNVEELNRTEKLRRELIGNISHDLRTPLAAVHGYAETMLLKQETLTAAERNQYTSVILQSSERLKKLVNALFELSKLEAKEVQVQPEPFVIAELMQEVLQEFTLTAQHKGLQLVCTQCKNPARVSADIGLIERVLQNLLDNALKYTPSGGTVILRLTQQQQMLEISVTDTGPGIPDTLLPYLFDHYQRYSQAPTEGAGLGLVIVKKILELHQTQIFVSSKLGQGTRFWFQLPCYQPAV
ncbi:sensor histidine kinase [Adhaeribacter arboris]|uniref:histidine kinase n=1 Tax=Adhaeribacter arboris TaxID=2072846 RepID=A0A2T2YF22_9BACT|nr:HAMP domain-containing sensor histidine kinase [Adhaeribacter arboris]PSR54102.1 sensor histidine kinase [Adhaeribacter arboris]